MTDLPRGKSLRGRILEAAFQRKVTAKLKTLPNTWFLKTSERSKSGIPDILMCVKGKFIAIELKRDEKSKPTKLQEHTLSLIDGAYGVAKTIHPGNWDEFWAWLKVQAE